MNLGQVRPKQHHLEASQQHETNAGERTDVTHGTALVGDGFPRVCGGCKLPASK